MQMTKYDRVSTSDLQSSIASAHLAPTHVPFTLAQLSQLARLQVTYQFTEVGQDGQKGYVATVSERPHQR